MQDISTILVKIFLDILISDQISLSPQVKQSVIISNKHGMCKLPYDSKLDITPPQPPTPSNKSPQAA